MEELDYNPHDLGKFLVERELYAETKYKLNTEDLRMGFYIPQIQEHCQKCLSVKPFLNKIVLDDAKKQYKGWPIPGVLEEESSLIKLLTFRCVTCEQECKNFSIFQVIENGVVFFTKTGEYPRKVLNKDRVLSNFYKKDKDLYNKAAICLSHGFGVGAFAYMRRIVENNIINLLDMISAGYNDDEKVVAALNDLRKESPMSDKISIANAALPVSLKPDGLNPLGAIYKALSEGVHSLSDEECLEKANLINQCMLFIINELANHKRNVEHLRKNISALRG